MKQSSTLSNQGSVFIKKDLISFSDPQTIEPSGENNWRQERTSTVYHTIFSHKYAAEKISLSLNTQTTMEDMYTDNTTEMSYRRVFLDPSRTWTMGKVSVVMLLGLSLTAILLDLVDAKLDTLESPDHYDALSADVIRPAFRYRSNSFETNPHKKRLRLGSAAMSSVSNAVGPMFPFHGESSSKNDENWSEGFIGSMSSLAAQVRSALPIPSSEVLPVAEAILSTRGGSKVAQKSSKKKCSFKTTLANSEPFIPLKDIAKLTLREVAKAFQYAVESSRPDFNLYRFTQGQSTKIKQMFSKISLASDASRGNDVEMSRTGERNVHGDVDALQFCAAMRIFAEWRVLRQVPDGYKGYAVGMNLGQKDVVQNVGKIEKAVHDYIQHQAEEQIKNNDESQLRSPTLRDLLQHEKNNAVHPKLPRLKEKSAAMGLLWVRRQLHYQTVLFSNVIQVPIRFDTAKDAISAAYQEVYDRYHGWAVQKIFNYSFQAAPDTLEVYKVMNPEKFSEVSLAAHSIQISDESFKVKSQKNRPRNPFEKILRHVAREWEKITGTIGQRLQSRVASPHQIIRGGSHLDEARIAQMEAFIRNQMEMDAKEHILAYLEVANPILADLASLMDEFNMDDPTKV